jgi:hypothetical protein
MATANKKDADPNNANATTPGSTTPPAFFVTWDEDGEPGSGLPTNLWATLLDINWEIWTYPSGDLKGKYQLVLSTQWLADDRNIGVNHDGVFENQESCGKLMNHLPSYDGLTPAELTGFQSMDQLRQFVAQLASGATQADGSPLLPDGTTIKAGQLVYIGEKVPTEKKHVLPNPDTKGAQQKRSLLTTMKDSQIPLPSDARDIHYFRGIRAYLVRMPHVTSMGLPGYGSKNRKDGRESEVLCITQIDPASVANLGKHMGAALTADGGSKPNGATVGAPAAQASAGAATGTAGGTSALAGVNPDVMQHIDRFLELVATEVGEKGSADFATMRTAIISGLKPTDKAKANGAVNQLVLKPENSWWWGQNGLAIDKEGKTITFAE